MTDSVQTDTLMQGDQGDSKAVHSPSSPERDYPQDLSQEVVSKLVTESKDKGYQKGYEAALGEIKKQDVISTSQPVSNSSITGDPSDKLTEDKVRQLMTQEIEKATHVAKKQAEEDQNKAVLNQLYSEVLQKVEASSANYDDYDEVTSILDASKIPHIIAYANASDNTGDILYELAKNPSKIASLHTLHMQDPRLAASEMKRLSDSIKDNQRARNPVHSVNPPLDQLKASTRSQGDAPPTFEELRRKYTN